MSDWMHKVFAYLDRKGKGSYPQPWWPLSKRLRLFSSQDLRGFCDLPVELVLQIISYIESDLDLDRLCLALTCTSLLELMNCWPLPPRWTELTIAMPKSIYDRYYPNDKIRTDRWELLRRLENAHWRRCMECYKLHPVDEFRKLDLWTSANARTCIFGKLVGIVRLCPCTEMTFRDKLRITKELIRRKQQEQQLGQSETSDEAQHGDDDHGRGLLPGFDPATDQHECTHECNDSWYRDQRIKAQRKLKFVLDDDHNLILETEYVATMLDAIPGDRKLAFLACPHLQLGGIRCRIESIDDLPPELHTRLPSERRVKLVQSYPGTFSCLWCKTTIFDVLRTWYRAEFPRREFTFTTRRCLGNAIEYADNIWYQQTETSIETEPWVQRYQNNWLGRIPDHHVQEPPR